jgi:hypothetical protein
MEPMSALLKNLNLNKLFHSPRTGGRFGKVNLAGIAFYNELIDSLLRKGKSQSLPTYLCYLIPVTSPCLR